MSVLMTPHHFSVFDYCALHEAGILDEDDRIELIEGEIIEMAPIGDRHIGVVNNLTSLFAEKLGRQVILSVQNSIRLNAESAPQPDIAIFAARPDGYLNGGAGPADTLLIVEVADSTIDYDVRIKAPLYAAAAIPEYWIVNLIQNRVEVFRAPEAGHYTQTFSVSGSDVLIPVAVPALVIAANDLFSRDWQT